MTDPGDYDPKDVRTWSAEMLAADLAYQRRPGVHTLTECECGRRGRRGGGACASCLSDELARRTKAAKGATA